ncbi:ANK_REP_REGION domain-containing protein [Psidium guajava]|nr:ANK_REP_REGION domain-containing protein [Psidium guajava]
MSLQEAIAADSGMILVGFLSKSHGQFHSRHCRCQQHCSWTTKSSRRRHHPERFGTICLCNV